MPTIEISKKDLCNLIGKKFSEEELKKVLSYAKSTIDSAEGDLLKVEIADVNRPDLWSAEGIAREIKTRLNKKNLYKVKRSSHKVIIDDKVKKVRPLIVCAIVKNLKLNDESIEQIIQLQEKLCESFGLKRKEVALGIYDFDKISWPISYETVKPDQIRFIPLGFNNEMTPKQILQKHEKGIKYAELLAGAKEYPILIDNAKKVLSMPPIINSEYSGKVTEKTKNVFIEVTGNSLRFIIPVLNIIVCALADRKGQIKSVTIKDKNKKLVTPNLKDKQIKINLDEINSIIGLKLSKKQIIDLASKSGFELKGKTINYPAYRQDILDTRDIIEDIAISYGYDNIGPQLATITTTGKFSEESVKIKKIINLLCGLNAQEIATFTLTNKDKLFRMMKKKGDAVEIANPVSVNYSCLRSYLLPSLIEFLANSKNVEYPQKIFEIGKYTQIVGNQIVDKTNLAFAIAHSKAGFTEAKQVLEYFLRNMKIKHKIETTQDDSFIAGRVGAIIVNGKKIGVIGELNPAVIQAFKLTMPVAAFELDLEKI